MKKNAFIVLLLLVVIAAAVMSLWLFFFRDSGPAEETPAPAPTPTPEWTNLPERTAEPEPTEPPEPEPTETPEPTQTPTPTPTPTPEPTPTPTPTPPADASGTFSSDTGTALNLLADWSVYTDASGNRKLAVTFSATHYTLRLDPSYHSLVLTVNGQSYSADCPAIAYNGGDLTTTALHTFTLDAPSGNLDIAAVWNYRGSYSGEELERITASGTVNLG